MRGSPTCAADNADSFDDACAPDVRRSAHRRPISVLGFCGYNTLVTRDHLVLTGV